MKTQITLLTLILLLTACSGSSNKRNGSDSEQMQAQTRFALNGHYFTLALPKGGILKGKAYKLLLAFHGSGGSDTGMQMAVRFENFSDDYIVVYPKSKEVEWDEGCECNIAHRLGAKDVEFITKLIEKMHAEYNLIERENYAVGFSQGGLFSQNMLCKHSELFKAVVSVASPMSAQLRSECKITHPTNYMLIQGTGDQVLPYNGLNDSNFPLISALNAIHFFAYQNLVEPEKHEAKLADNLTETIYSGQNGLINKLVSVEGGGHSWSFSGFKTTEEVLKFFNQSSAYPLPESSALYTLDNANYHVRTLGEPNNKGDIVILSGANKFFHSDSAWTSLIQPLLAEHARVHVIDRLGNAWSTDVEEPSFAKFSADLPKLLEILDIEKVTFLSFANSNIATLMYLNNPHPEIETKGVIWADPDILLPHSIAQYQSGSVAALRKYKNEYIEHVRAGNWTDKSAERIAIEREEIAALIPSSHQDKMDWLFYDKVTKQRLGVDKQVTRIKEMMNYHDDLNTAQGLQHNISVPISVIDSDFERLDIATANDESKSGLIKWQQEGTQWSKDIAYKTQGKYYALSHASHQVLFEHPDTVIEAVLELMERDE